QRQAGELLATAKRDLGDEVVREIETKVRSEMAANEWEIAVSFSSFSIGKVKRDLGVQIDEDGDFFVNVAPISVSALLLETLKNSTPLALKIDTEKARSELMVAPVLLEIHRQLGGKISLFSGVDWNVDEALGLRGRCDFLMGLSP